MPHDCKGRKIDIGDVVKTKKWNAEGKFEIKKVNHIFEGATSCELGLFDFEPHFGQGSANAKDSEIVIKADGSEPAKE